MSKSSKLLSTILVVGLFYSFLRLFTGTGGSGLGDFLDALGYTSLVLFFVSIVILLFNYRHLREHIDTFIFLLIGLPMTLMALTGAIEFLKFNEAPALTARYPRPVSEEQYRGDSAHIQTAIDSLVALRNRITGGVKIQSAFIDTIIYSPKGDQIFVSYVNQFEPNDLGNDLDPDYLYGHERNPDYWNLEEGTPNAHRMSGSFHDLNTLKTKVRKYYFNQYSFAQEDSLKENYFWK